MKHSDNVKWREWVDLDLDSALGSAEKTEFKRLQQSPELVMEQRQLSRLHTLLAEDRITVRPGFQEKVMAALPVAAWEPRNQERLVPSWALPCVLALTFGAAAAAFLGTSLGNSQAIGLVATILDFFQTTTLAGAGLLFATWQGVSLGLGELFAGSKLSLAVFGAAVLGLNLLIVSYLKRRHRAIAVDRQQDR
jgi:hypothetical protein